MLSVGRFRRRCQRSFLRSSHRSTNIAFGVSNNATRPKRTRAYEAADPLPVLIEEAQSFVPAADSPEQKRGDDLHLGDEQVARPGRRDTGFQLHATLEDAAARLQPSLYAGGHP